MCDWGDVCVRAICSYWQNNASSMWRSNQDQSHNYRVMESEQQALYEASCARCDLAIEKRDRLAKEVPYPDVSIAYVFLQMNNISLPYFRTTAGIGYTRDERYKAAAAEVVRRKRLNKEALSSSRAYQEALSELTEARRVRNNAKSRYERILSSPRHANVPNWEQQPRSDGAVSQPIQTTDQVIVIDDDDDEEPFIIGSRQPALFGSPQPALVGIPQTTAAARHAWNQLTRGAVPQTTTASQQPNSLFGSDQRDSRHLPAAERHQPSIFTTPLFGLRRPRNTRRAVANVTRPAKRMMLSVEDRDAKEGEDACVICTSNYACIKSSSCGHRVMCFDCSSSLGKTRDAWSNKCPVCRRGNTDFVVSL